MYRFLSIISYLIVFWPRLDKGTLAMDKNGAQVKGLIPRRKIFKLGRKFMRSGQIKASVRCSNLLACTKRHIVRHFFCRNFGIVGRRNGKKFPPKVFVGDDHEEKMRFVPSSISTIRSSSVYPKKPWIYGFHQIGVFKI